LRLYVTGATPASARAIVNLKALCEGRLKGRFQLEVIDIFQKPALAAREQIVAAPTLVKVLPPPLRRFIGDLSDLEGKLFGFDVRPSGDLPKGRPPPH
jgi:circadian clock protein KaiB